MSRSRQVFIILLSVGCACWCAAGPVAFARLGPAPQPAGAGTVNLPYLAADNLGGQWRIYQNGWLQQQSNMPVYSQGAMLTVNGGQPTQNTNQARLDEKTGELIIENLNANGLSVTRRILIDKTQGYVRYIDIFRNTQNQDQQANISLQTNLNFGVTNSQMVPDPKKPDHNLAWVAQTGGGACAVELFGGRNAKIVPSLNWPQGNNFVQAATTLTIPAGKEAAIMHLHCTAPTSDAGVQFVSKLDERRLLRGISPELRRIIANFVSGDNLIGDIEILRGDLLDVVELRSGDQFRGTLKENAYDLQAFYGAVSVPVNQVIGLINVGQFRPHQLVITADGQIFGGNLKKQTIDLQLSSGQVTQIPLAQMSRVGYRRRPNETDTWNFDGKAMVTMRTGERIGIQLPTSPIEIASRYGRLSIKPEAIGRIVLQSEDSSVHIIQLTDGSRFSGILAPDEFTMTLEGPGNQVVKFPTSSMSRLQLAGRFAEVDDNTPTLHLTNEDLLVGTITGKLKLNTAFDTITVNASEMKGLTRAEKSPADVQVTLWDGTTLSGELEDQELSCSLRSGVTMSVPAALVEQYAQPLPQPSASMILRIKSILKDLNSEDWKQREHAQATLISVGPVAISTLQQLRPGLPPEAQKNIDSVLKELESQRLQQKSGSTGAAAAAPPPEQLNDN